MSSLHHTFDVNLASKYSIEEAILIHHFQFWISKNKRSTKHLHQGRAWMFDSAEDIADYFPYWSRDQVKRILNKLVKNNIIIKGNFNKTGYDRTNWYAFKDEEKFIFIEKGRNRPMDLPKSPNRNSEIAPPIPDTTTDTKTYKQQHKPKKPKEDVVVKNFLEKKEKEWIKEERDKSLIKEAIDIFKNKPIEAISNKNNFIEGIFKIVEAQQKEVVDIIGLNKKWIEKYCKKREVMGNIGILNYNSHRAWDQKSNVQWNFNDLNFKNKIKKFYKNYR